MHRLLRPLLVVSVCLLALQITSLWMVRFSTPSRQTLLSLGQGCFRVFVAQDAANVHPAASRGFVLGGWTGDVLWWKPELNANHKVWVRAPGAPMASQIAGFGLMLPIAYPLIVILTATGVAWAFVRRAARLAAAGKCRACGYDLSGLPGQKCPECGGLIARLLRRLWPRPNRGPDLPAAV